MEKLVEEIQDIYKAGRERRIPNMSPQELITLIGKAYADGRLKLPGEEWRGEAWVENGIEHFPRGKVEVRPPINALENFPRMMGFDVIALRKEGDR